MITVTEHGLSTNGDKVYWFQETYITLGTNGYESWGFDFPMRGFYGACSTKAARNFMVNLKVEHGRALISLAS